MNKWVKKDLAGGQWVPVTKFQQAKVDYDWFKAFSKNTKMTYNFQP